MENRTLFVVFEGLDGTGKTTLLSKVSKLLPSQNVEVLRFPYFDDVRQIALSKNYLLSDFTRQTLMISDFNCKISEILARQEKPRIILSDRFTPISSMVYYGKDDVIPFIKSSIEILQQFNPVYLVYLLTNPPFRKLGGDYFEDQSKITEKISKYKDVVTTEFPNKVLGTNRYKYIYTEIDVRYITPTTIAQDILTLSDLVEISKSPNKGALRNGEIN